METSIYEASGKGTLAELLDMLRGRPELRLCEDLPPLSNRPKPAERSACPECRRKLRPRTPWLAITDGRVMKGHWLLTDMVYRDHPYDAYGSFCTLRCGASYGEKSYRAVKRSI